MRLDESQHIKVRLLFIWMFYAIHIASYGLFPRVLHFLDLAVIYIPLSIILFMASVIIHKKFSTEVDDRRRYRLYHTAGLILLAISVWRYIFVANVLDTNYDMLDSRPDLDPEAYILYYTMDRIAAAGLIIVSLSFLYRARTLRQGRPMEPETLPAAIAKHIHKAMLAIIVFYPLFSIIFVPYFHDSWFGVLFTTFFGYPIMISLIYLQNPRNSKYDYHVTVFALLFFTLWSLMITGINGDWNSPFYAILNYLFFWLIFAAPLMAIFLSIILAVHRIRKGIVLKWYEVGLAYVFTILSFFPVLWAWGMSNST